jgi:hypothetical protein
MKLGMNELLISKVVSPHETEQNINVRKIFNTQFNSHVFRMFSIYCSKKDKFHKDVFPEIMKTFMNEHEDKKIGRTYNLQGKDISNFEIKQFNFECDMETSKIIKKYKIKKGVQLNILFEQAIVYYLNKLDYNLE